MENCRETFQSVQLVGQTRVCGFQFSLVATMEQLALTRDIRDDTPLLFRIIHQEREIEGDALHRMRADIEVRGALKPCLTKNTIEIED